FCRTPTGSKEQQAPSPPSPLHSTPLFFPMPLLPPPPHLLPLTSFPHTPLLLLSLTLTQARRNMEDPVGVRQDPVNVCRRNL
ncbi:hypothetical protein QJQ45_018947, partial [Haematococcus lacustris]